MIQNTDLRIGNWINVLGKNCQAVDVLCDSVNTEYHEGIPYGTDVEGIILTGELLDSCGFERPGKGDFYGGWLIEISNGEKIRISKTRNEWFWHKSNYVSVEVSCLHQLQNLYFSLTGKELTINL